MNNEFYFFVVNWNCRRHCLNKKLSILEVYYSSYIHEHTTNYFYSHRRFEQQLTAHLNTIDTTPYIKFTYQEESEGSLRFLDTLMVRKGDGTIKHLVYRKKTHTDKYLKFSSHHPLHMELGVKNTLLDRCHCQRIGGQTESIGEHHQGST